MKILCPECTMKLKVPHLCFGELKGRTCDHCGKLGNFRVFTHDKNYESSRHDLIMKIWNDGGRADET